MNSRVALITFLDGGTGGPGVDNTLPGQPVYPSQGLPWAPGHPSQGLPVGPGHPSQGLPWAPGHPSQGLPNAPVRPDQPIYLPVWPFDPTKPVPPPTGDTLPVHPIEAGMKFVLKCTLAFGMILVPDAEPKSEA